MISAGMTAYKAVTKRWTSARRVRMQIIAYAALLSVSVAVGLAVVAPSASMPAPQRRVAPVVLWTEGTTSTLGPLRFVDHGSDADALQRIVLHEPTPGAVDAEFDSAVQAVYFARAFRPLWLDAGGHPTAAAIKMISELEGAGRRGLDAHDYTDLAWSDSLFALQAGAGRPLRAQFDLALTNSALRLATHLHRGRIDPRQLKFGIDVTTKRLNLPAVAESLAAAVEPAEALAKLEPAAPGYRQLQGALAQYLSLQHTVADKALPAPRDMPLEPGDLYDGREALTERLRVLGDFAGTESADFVGPPAPRYEPHLVAAVQRFQARHGLEPDGRIGAGTWAALNVPLSQRVEQIRFAMERWRWLPDLHASTSILVNIADFKLRAFDGSGGPALQMPVVVGRAARHETPVFAEQMRSVVFRPSWSVPLSIVRNEMLQKIEKDPEYFRENGFDVVGSEDQTLTPDTVAGLRSGKIALRQRPGEGNALGRVKFLFPNRHSVYLHDTPSRSLFSKARRDLSHGCVRVGDPEALARWVLRNRPEWTEERIRNAMSPGSPQVAVNVDPPIPVYITYLTAMVGDNGELMFFDDLYGHDKDLHAALNARVPQGRVEAIAAAFPAITPAAARVGAAGSALFAANLSAAQVSSGDALRQSALAE